jgi:signal transduction histidine kinase
MENSDTAAAIFADLRRLSAESPRDARMRLAALLDSGSNSLDEIFRRASALGEGRLRQLIANTVRNRKDKARVVSHLARWHENETDEFTKAAISAALANVEPTAFQLRQPPTPPQLVETYRYVASRLCHRVRNSLTGTAQHLRRLELLLNGASDPKSGEAKVAVANLKDALRGVGRVVEFNIEDSYFQWRVIDLAAWLKSMTDQYIARNSSLILCIQGLEAPQIVRIRANDLLLETLFWNLWKNAQQATGTVCEIGVHVAFTASEAELLIMDNGRGFTAEDAELAFLDQFSRRGANYGRGLLEVQDAVQRLGGRIELTRVAGGEYRIKLTLPLATP